MAEHNLVLMSAVFGAVFSETPCVIIFLRLSAISPWKVVGELVKCLYCGSGGGGLQKLANGVEADACICAQV